MLHNRIDEDEHKIESGEKRCIKAYRSSQLKSCNKILGYRPGLSNNLNTLNSGVLAEEWGAREGQWPIKSRDPRRHRLLLQWLYWFSGKNVFKSEAVKTRATILA